MIERVGLVCPYSFESAGGVQNHVLGLAEWLSNNGVEVGILAPDEISDAQLGDYGLNQTQFYSAGKAVPIPVNGSIARVNFSPEALASTRRWLTGSNWDLIHVHEPLTPNLSMLAMMNAKVPVTATFHTAMPVKKALTHLNQAFPRFADRVDAAIAVSGVAANVVNRHAGIHPEIIGNGLRISDYPCQATSHRWRGGSRPRITFLGRYDEPRKGFDIFASALPMIREKFSDLDVVVVGSGSPRSLTDVRFLGSVSDQTRNQILASTDVYIAPQTGRESFGIVLLEALACGAPVVASDLPAFIEVLTDESGLVGKVFKTGDPVSLATQVVESLNEPRDLRLERGYKLASSYDWDQLGPQILQQYQKAAVRFESRGITNPSAAKDPITGRGLLSRISASRNKVISSNILRLPGERF